MTTSIRIAVLQISFGALREVFEVEDASEGWSAFEGADGTRLEVSPRGAALLVRFDGPVGTLAACFGELWQQHGESRGVAVHDEAPEGDDYDSLVEGASWEGGLFAQAASELGGSKRAPSEDEAGEGEAETEGEGEGEGKADGEEDPFDAVADKLMSAVAKRSSRKVLAVRLAADKGEKDLGDVLDAMESEDAEGDDALVSEVEGRFAFDVEHQEMAELLSRKLTTEEEGEDAEAGEAEQATGEDKADASE